MSTNNEKVTKEDILESLYYGLGIYDEEDEEEEVERNRLENDSRVDNLVKWANKYPVAWWHISNSIGLSTSFSQDEIEELLELGEIK